MKRTWFGIVGVVLAALTVIVALDFAAARVVPPVNRREVEDGVRDLRQSNPDILVLGSSHARTFHAVGRELARQTGNQRVLVDVPVEQGKLVVYDWVLQNRLVPLIEERNPDGSRRRDRLRQFILLTEWWDSCAPKATSKFPPYWNLPARAWTAREFLVSVLEDGLNGYNRNYLQNRLRRTLARSALIYDRTQGGLVWRVLDRLQGKPSGRTPEQKREQDEGWQRMVEGGINCIADPEQMSALTRIVDYARQQGFEVTVVLFPRKPITITTLGLSTTIESFKSAVHAAVDSRGVRVLDMTLSTPLTDADFMDDNDHVNEVGNEKFARWGLAGPLRFLMEPAGAERSSGILSGAGR
jgi:hypothetical protein